MLAVEGAPLVKIESRVDETLAENSLLQELARQDLARDEAQVFIRDGRVRRHLQGDFLVALDLFPVALSGSQPACPGQPLEIRNNGVTLAGREKGIFCKHCRGSGGGAA